MTDQPGLFELLEPPAAPPVKAPRDRGRRGEHWTRCVVADLRVIDSRALRDATSKLLAERPTIVLEPADDDADLPDEHEEIAAGNAAAVRYWIDPTTGIWPELAEALRLDLVHVDTTDQTPHRVRLSWSVTVTIIDIHLLRGNAVTPHLPEKPFPELWNRIADPFAPLAGLPGATWEPISVQITRGR